VQLVAADARRGGRQQADLHLAGERHVVIEGLLLEHLVVQHRLLDRERGCRREEPELVGVRLRVRLQNVALEVQRADHYAAHADRDCHLGQGARPSRDVVGIPPHVGRHHGQAGSDHLADDALTRPEHRVLTVRVVVEAHGGHCGNQAPRMLARHVQRAIEDEHAGRVVRDHLLNDVEQVAQDLGELEGAADALRQLEQQLVPPGRVWWDRRCHGAGNGRSPLDVRQRS
jgi:hypothetical protein